jgi:hypothetical protein
MDEAPEDILKAIFDQIRWMVLGLSREMKRNVQLTVA